MQVAYRTNLDLCEEDKGAISKLRFCVGGWKDDVVIPRKGERVALPTTSGLKLEEISIK